MNMDNEYKPCEYCGGKIIDDEPSLLPLSDDCVLKVIDQKCTRCGMRFIGKHQKTKMYTNKEEHDKLVDMMNQAVHGCTI